MNTKTISLFREEPQFLAELPQNRTLFSSLNIALPGTYNYCAHNWCINRFSI